MAKTEDKVAAEATLERGHRKTRRGYVSSDKMDKTIVVEVEDRVKHPLYGKVIRRISKVKVHDETNSAGIGDSVAARSPQADRASAIAEDNSRVRNMDGAPKEATQGEGPVIGPGRAATAA